MARIVSEYTAEIREHVEELFEGAPATRKAVELREEMIQNLEDKFSDLVNEGKSEEAAFNIVIAGIGNIDALLMDLELDTPGSTAAKRKSALFTSIAVMMYILSVIPVIVMDRIVGGDAIIGVVMMFVLVAGATGLLIYNSMTKPKYLKESDDMVEEFREWQHESSDRKSLRKAISSALWSTIVVAYILISFATRMWHVTWVIFIIGCGIESLIEVFLATKKKK